MLLIFFLDIQACFIPSSGFLFLCHLIRNILETNSKCFLDLIHSPYIASSIIYMAVVISYIKSQQTSCIKSQIVDILHLWAIWSLSHLLSSALIVWKQPWTIHKQMAVLCSNESLFTKQLPDQIFLTGSSLHTSVI